MGKPTAAAGGDPPTFDSGIHTSLFYWNAEDYADVAAAVADADSIHEQRGTLAIDTTNGPTGGKCGRVDWGASGCSGTDGDVQFGHNIGTHTGNVILASMAFKSTASYNNTMNCGPDQKLLIFGPTSSTCPRTVIGISGSGETFPINCPDPAPFDDLFCTGTTWYVNQDFAPGTTHGGEDFGSYRDGLRHGAPDSDLVWDTNWHEFIVRITLESVIDSGEGRVEHWTRTWGGSWRKTMNHLGDTPGNDAYQKVHTGTSAKGSTVEVGVPTLNGGPNTDGAKFYFQYIRLYYPT